MNECTDTPLGVHAAHDVADGAVLAGGIQGLEHDEDAVGVLGCEASLVLSQQLDASLEEFGAVPLLDEIRLVGGIEVLCQRHLGAGCDAQRLDELRDALRSLVGHVVTPSARGASFMPGVRYS